MSDAPIPLTHAQTRLMFSIANDRSRSVRIPQPCTAVCDASSAGN